MAFCRSAAVVCVLAVSAQAWGGVSGGDGLKGAVQALGDSPVAAVLEHVDEDVRIYNEHITTLANPFFEGRAAQTRGKEIAAEYIQWYFQRFGLEPAISDGEAGTYRQAFAVGTERRLGPSAVAWGAGDAEANGGAPRLEHGVDYSVLPESAAGSFEGPLVFVGYSIPRGPGEHEDYSSYEPEDDLTGKVALIFRYEPLDEGGASRWAGAGGWTPAAMIERKLGAAIGRGAGAVILVNPPGVSDPSARGLIEWEDRRPARRRGRRGAEEEQRVPSVMLSAAGAARLVESAGGPPLGELRRVADEGGGAVELGGLVRVEAEFEESPILTENVAGVLPGRGSLADEYLVIGAHYDHVGYGNFGSLAGARGQIHPGADDNGSGTSALLLAAQRLSESYAALGGDAEARSIIFIAFGAEEMGLRGSAHYVQNPSVDRSKIYAMLNMDMVGRMRDRKLEVSGIGTGQGLAEALRPHLEASGLEIRSHALGTGRSDHASFQRAQIPAVFFFTGLHAQYHRPTDESWRINRAGGAKVARLAHDAALTLARRAEPMPFVEVNEPRPMVLMNPDQERDEPPAPEPQPEPEDEPAEGPGGIRVSFGIQPDADTYSGSIKGVGVASVTPGTPADQAGLLRGDVIVRWNNNDVEDIHQWMDLLREHSPGDQVRVVVEREGRRVTRHAILTGR